MGLRSVWRLCQAGMMVWLWVGLLSLAVASCLMVWCCLGTGGTWSCLDPPGQKPQGCEAAPVGKDARLHVTLLDLLLLGPLKLHVDSEVRALGCGRREPVAALVVAIAAVAPKPAKLDVMLPA